jgi:putative nucleotidyltransferase with HDIG domain
MTKFERARGKEADRMTALNWRGLLYGPFLFLTIVGGLAVYAGALSRLPGGRVGEVALFALLCGLAQLMPVPLFRNSSMSVAFAVCFAALVYLGPEAAVCANLASGLVAALRPRPKPPLKALWNVGALGLAAALAGAVYALAGGAARPERLEWAMVPPAVLAITAYFFANTGSLAAVIALSSRASLGAVWGVNYRWLAPNYVGMGLIGFGMGAAVAAVGLLGVALFLIPLAMAWYSFKLYMARTEEVRRRNAELQLTNAQLDVANARLSQRVGELAALNRIGLSLNGSLDLANVLGEILGSALQLVPSAGAAAVALAGPQGGPLQVAAAAGLPPAAAAALAAPGGPAARAFAGAALLALPDAAAAGEDALAAAGVGALVALPLRFGGAVGGVFAVTFAGPHAPGEDERLLLATLGEQAATAVHNARLYQEIEQGYLATVQALVTVVDARERYAPGHAGRVRAYALAAAAELGLDAKAAATLELAALFHDIGHVGVPEAVLAKGGALTPAEWEMVRKHPALGASILRQVPRMEAVLPVVLQHHERYDGQGYPEGRLGDDTHPLAQLLAVADAFEAMTSPRPHRPALGRAQALAELHKGAGTQFAPRAVDALARALAAGKPLPAAPAHPAFARLFAR